MTRETEIIGPVHGSTTGKRADLVPLPSLDQVRQYIRASKAENTLRSYQSDWRDFCAWCEAHGICPLPARPETVASFIAERAIFVPLASGIGHGHILFLRGTTLMAQPFDAGTLQLAGDAFPVAGQASNSTSGVQVAGAAPRNTRVGHLLGDGKRFTTKLKRTGPKPLGHHCRIADEYQVTGRSEDGHGVRVQQSLTLSRAKRPHKNSSILALSASDIEEEMPAIRQEGGEAMSVFLARRIELGRGSHYAALCRNAVQPTSRIRGKDDDTIIATRTTSGGERLCQGFGTAAEDVDPHQLFFRKETQGSAVRRPKR